MIKYFFILLSISSLFATAKIPIILIHGFMGWGRDEMPGYYYWGGLTDLEEYLTSEGFEVYTVSVGPISSNWDRANEAFYQIKGGQVDYGFYHSKKYDIIQKPEGKSYAGLYPGWDEDHPVHIITHSQGGQTARMLEYLLKNKFEGESSLLLSNKKNGWIKSITTISCPHNGTILSNLVSEYFPFLQHMTAFFGILQDSKISELYDFDLDQWNLIKYEDESFNDYYDRVSNSKIKDSKNFSAWDLSIQGAEAFNDIYSTDPNVYYFAYPTYSTIELADKTHIPDLEMSVLAWAPSMMIGSSSEVDDEWHMNDGIVSTISMKYPIKSNGQSEPNKIFDSNNIQPGVWQVMEPLHQDHHIVIGHKFINLDVNKMKLFYKEICNRLYDLD